MKYFLIIQEGVKDTEPEIEGPYPSIQAAQKAAESGYEAENNWIFTVLEQRGTNFKQVSQVSFAEVVKFPWKP